MPTELLEATKGRVQTRLSTASVSSTTTVATETEQENEHGGPLQLEELLAHGFVHADLELLRKACLSTVECVAFAPERTISTIKGISEQKCQKLKTACRGLLGLGFCSATDFLEARENLIKFTTGCVELDSILRGGIETGNITELVGEFRTGKTQLCHTLAVTCQLPIRMSGGEGRCLWIDTEGTFRPERIVAISARFQMQVNIVLDNIVYARAFNTDHLLQLLLEAAALMSRSRFALMIVDSIIALYRSEFSGRSELPARQSHLGRSLRALQRIADTFGVAVVVTNQVMAKPDSMPNASDKVPTGGHVLAHSSQTRLFMRKGRLDQRICKIIDSPSLPENEAAFCITEGGIFDVPGNGSNQAA